ncbi:MAG: carbon monoxide dehydrogenase, partial [Alphaproteobacteria bacterium]
YPAALVALGATIVTNARSLPAADFFTGMFETALDHGEIIVAVEFPIGAKAAYMKFRNPASRYAMAGVFVADHGAGDVRVAVTGAGPCVFRWRQAEDALARRFAPEALAGLLPDASALNNDLHAGADYRAHLVAVMARRAVGAIHSA